ncbi:ATP-binding protein [Streptomyces sp. NPDC014894]|uniref:ATP-binding protein n=1 Tax=Streptomyces sp. NPDC014894 TaxID=3364931 RepID=UPI0036F79C15
MSEPTTLRGEAPVESPVSTPLDEGETAYAGLDADDDHADLIRRLRQQGLPSTFVRGPIKGRSVAFGSGDSAGTIYKTTYYGNGGPSVDPADGPVSEEEFATLSDLYVRPGTHQTLVDHLKKHRVALLRGAPGSGRYTLARLALRDVAKEGVVVLDAEAGVRRLLKDDGGLQPGKGHVIEGDGMRWVSQLRAQLLNLLRGATHVRLRGESYVRSPLVIVLDDRVSPMGLEDHIVEHEIGESARYEVFERHLTTRLSDRPEECRKLLEHEGLTEDLRGHRSLREIDLLAEGLARRVHSGDTIDAIVSGLTTALRCRAVELLTAQPRDAAGEDPKADVSLWSRAFLLAGVVLDGMALSRVSRESHRLAELLHGVRSPSLAPAMPLFAESVKDWLAGQEMEFVDRKGSPVDERYPGCRVRVRPSGLGEAVMEVLWHDHSGARGPLLEWLDGLVDKDEEDIRVSAAQTVGLLAAFDWPYVYEELLVRWASDKGDHAVRRHFAAAWALERAVADPLLAPQVQQLLRRWSQQRDFQSCAQAAYGTRIGAMYPAEALDGLERIGQSGMKSVWAAVREIYAAGSRVDVLERLTAWSGSSRHWLRDDAAKCLLRLSRIRGEGAVTEFLKDPGTRGLLLLLVRQLLLSKSEGNHRCCWSALKLWVEQARDEEPTGPPGDAGPPLRELIAEFAAEVPEPGERGSGLREQLRFYLRLWCHQFGTAEATGFRTAGRQLDEDDAAVEIEAWVNDRFDTEEKR